MSEQEKGGHWDLLEFLPARKVRGRGRWRLRDEVKLAVWHDSIRGEICFMLDGPNSAENTLRFKMTVYAVVGPAMFQRRVREHLAGLVSGRPGRELEAVMQYVTARGWLDWPEWAEIAEGRGV